MTQSLTHYSCSVPLFADGEGSSSGPTAEELAAEAAARDTSEADKRRSAQLTGAIAITFITLVALLIVLLDLSRVVIKMERVKKKSCKVHRVPVSQTANRNSIYKVRDSLT